MNQMHLFGTTIHSISFSEAVGAIHELIESASKHYIITPNVDHIIRLQNDRQFKRVYEGASLVLPDGMPLIWASRLLGKRLVCRVTGADLVPAICSLAEQKGYGIYLLGSTTPVVQAAELQLRRTFPGLIVSGTHHGFLQDGDEEGVIKAINAAAPHVLFVGMGSPKQELWVMQNIESLNIKVALCIGGVLEIIAGTRQRAPAWMQRTGFEWMYRLLQEPRRLWKRYLVDDMVFFRIVAREWLHGLHGARRNPGGKFS